MGRCGGTISSFIIPRVSEPTDPFLSLPPITNEGSEQSNHSTARWHPSEKPWSISALFLSCTPGSHLGEAHYCSTAAHRPSLPHNANGTLSPRCNSEITGEIQKCLQTLPHVHWGNKCWSGRLTTSVVKWRGQTATPKHSTRLLKSQMPTSTWDLPGSYKVNWNFLPVDG